MPDHPLYLDVDDAAGRVTLAPPDPDHTRIDALVTRRLEDDRMQLSVLTGHASDDPHPPALPADVEQVIAHFTVRPNGDITRTTVR